MIDYRRDVVLVGAGAEEAGALRARIARREPIKTGQQLNLRKSCGRV